MSNAFANQWSILHIAGCVAAFAGFVASIVASTGYMLQVRMLKTKRINVLQRFLPALDRSERFAHATAAFGFVMLTLAVLTGVQLSKTKHGIWWSWSAKEIFSLLTWLVYAAYLHLRVFNRWRGKWNNWLIVTGFVCILTTLLLAIVPHKV